MTDDGRQISDDELIGAMHDGELSAADRARAEHLLARDPARRRELAELAELSSKLQSLPRASLGEGFAAEVLRRAEREMLTTARPTPVDEPTTSIGLPRRWLPQGRRPWLWAGAALAAGVVIMLFGPQGNERIAEHTAVVKPVAVTAVEHEAALDRASARPQSPPAMAPESAVAPAAKSAPLPALMSTPVATPAPTSATAGAAAMPAQSLAPVGQSFGTNGYRGDIARNEQQVAEQIESLGYASPVNRHLAQQATVVETLNRDAAVDDGLVVVEVDVDRRQLDADPFAQVLLDNGIQCVTVPQVQQANLSNNLQQSQLARSRAVTSNAALVQPSDADFVYVVAGADQLQQTIAQLQAGQNTYRRVLVRSGTDGSSANAIGNRSAGVETNVEKKLKEDQAAGDKQRRDGDLLPGSGAKENMTREQVAPLRKTPGDLPPADPKPSAPAAEKARPKDTSDAEGLDAFKRKESDKLAKQSAQQRSRGWFGRLTLPPADTPAFNDSYFVLNPRDNARAPANERGELAKSSEVKLQVANQAKDLSSDEARMAQDAKAKGELSANQPALSGGDQRSGKVGEPPLQRALFVFRVVDAPVGAATAQPSTATTTAPASAPAASPSPAKPVKPAEPKSPPESKP